MSHPKFHLVTPYAIYGSTDHDLLDRTMRMLRYTYNQAAWNAMFLFTTIEPRIKVPGVTLIQIPHFDGAPYCAAFNIMVNRTISAVMADFDYSLLLHEDGFPIDYALWNNVFLEYDWISAPWGDVVGCGAALRSSRMMEEICLLPWYDGKQNEDEWVARTNRNRLMEHGMKFAPPELALQFATECVGNDLPSFAFHGRHHCPQKYKLGWDKIHEWERDNDL